jgi:transposase
MTLYCGVDFHSRRQTVCYCNTDDGEIKVKELQHYKDDVRSFYEQFKDEQVIVGYETSGYSHWFENLLFELKIEIWVGDAVEIRRLAKWRQKNDRRDAEHILDLMLRDEFPRLYRRGAKSQEILRLLRHRHKLVKHGVMIKNSLRRILIETGKNFKTNLASKKGKQKLRELDLPLHLEDERDRWLGLLIDFEKQIAEIEKRLKQEARSDEQVQRLLTHPGVGLLTALCIVHTLGDVSRFPTTRKVAAYAGLDPMEHSSGETRRFGSISKAGNRLLRFLLGEAAHMAARSDDQLREFFKRLSAKHGTSKAVVATARKLLIRCFIMLRDEIDYLEFRRRGIEVRSAPRLHIGQKREVSMPEF